MPSHRFFLVHVAMVIVLAAMELVAFYTSEDASIGGGFALLVLQALGLPWSFAAAANMDVNGNWQSTLVYAALALANAVVLRWVSIKRRRSRSLA